MKHFVRDNLAIVAAIALPLILVGVFVISTAVTNRVVDDPRFDFLMATNFYGGQNEAFYFDVVQNSLKISYTFPTKVNGGYQNGNIARLWRVHVPAMTVEEISLVPPQRGADDADGKRIPVEIAGVSDLRMNTSQPSPDGYVFRETYDYDNNFMIEIFGGRRNGGPVSAIVKDGRVIPVTGLGGPRYSYYNIHFIGWIAEGQ